MTLIRIASTHVSSSSQTLAQGVSEQAASLGETTGALGEMSSMTRKNAETAQQASVLAAGAPAPDCLTGHVLVYGVEGESFGWGIGLSQRVERAARELAETIIPDLMRQAHRGGA